LARDGKRGVKPLDNSLCRSGGFFLANLFEQNDELVSGEPREGVGGPETAPGSTSDFDEHCVTGFTETLRAELDGTGVVVSQVLPGPVETGFDEAANIGPPGMMDRIFRISAARCAREVIQGFEKGRPMIFPGSAYRTAMALQGIVPRGLQRRAARSQGRSLRKTST
jgi:hypothetical protein